MHLLHVVTEYSVVQRQSLIHTPALQVLKGEWAGREGEVQALADEREAIVNVAGAAERATQILDRSDLGRIVKDGEADDLP